MTSFFSLFINKLQHGAFTLNENDSLKEKTKDIPNGYGAYIIRANTADGEILYIGKSGTIKNNGDLKKQDLKKRLNNVQDNKPRADYFKENLKENEGLNELYFDWYIIDPETKILPAFLEAVLIQEYYSKHQALPAWNNGY